MKPLLSMEQITLQYTQGGTAAVDGLSLTLEQGEILALLGPSGCGKTTTLRLVAGFEQPQAGRIILEDRVLCSPDTFVAPSQRRVGMVFQDYALFPHLSVLDNVTFGLASLPRSEQVTRAREMLALFSLSGLEMRMPHSLSGGQQQRVALARALAPRPRVLLLDEAFSSLDAALRVSTRAEVRRVLKSLETTVLLVTHDQEEAMAFADRLAVMKAGRVEQVGTPESVYAAPRNSFVASFLGGTNLLPGTASDGTVRTAMGDIPLVGQALGPVLVSLRPEALRLVSGTEPRTGVPDVQVLAREFQGHGAEFTVKCGELELKVRGVPELPLRPGDKAQLEVVGKAVVLEGAADSASPHE
jgi:iron(III) transport system ATP-binding protein